MHTALEKVYRARVQLILHHPFFGVLAMKSKILIDPTCKTAWTDGTTYGFNSNFIDSLTDDELIGVLVHEVLHDVLCHMYRRNDRNIDKWNKACDYVVNPIIKASKTRKGQNAFTLPKGHLYDPKYSELDADTIYNRLPNEPNPPRSNGSKSGNNTTSEKGGKSEGNSGKTSKQSKDTEVVNIDSTQQSISNTGGCDETDINQSGTSDTVQISHESCGEVRDAKGPDNAPLSNAKRKEAENNMKVRVQQAAASARKAGNLPGNIKKLIAELTEPKLNWAETLYMFMDNASKSDYSYRRPNKRMMMKNIIVPTLFSNDLGNIAIALDTSGSMSPIDLAECATEISSILEQFSCTINVLYVDTIVHRHDEFTSNDLPLEFDAKGGGGTSFELIAPYIEENNIDLKALIILTDGYVTNFGEEPNYPVIVVQTHNVPYTRPDWIEVINMN